MKKFVCAILALTLVLGLPTACSKKNESNPVSEVRVLLPVSTGTKATVEGEAVIATQLYILSRAYIDKLAEYDTEDPNNFDAEDYNKLLNEATETVRIAEEFISSFEGHADLFAEAEENNLIEQEESSYEVVSLSSGCGNGPVWGNTVYADKKSPAEKYAEEITEIFDNAQNGQKLKTLAEAYGTDITKAKLMLEQAQAILEGAAYEEQADFENKCYEIAVETKAAASTIGFGVAVASTMGTGGFAAASFIEGGGLIMNGVSAFIDVGTAVNINLTHGEGDEYTAAWERTSEIFAPVNAVFSIAGGIQNIKDFRDPEKVEEMVDNAAQALLTGIAITRDYVQEGTVIGVSSRIIDGYREIIIQSVDTADKEAAEELLEDMGVEEEADEDLEDISLEGLPEDIAEVYIEEAEGISDPKNPVDMEAFIESLDEVFRDCAEDDGIDVPAPFYTEEIPQSEPVPSESAAATEEVPPETEPAVTESESVLPDSDPVETTPLSETPGSGSPLSAENVAGTYYFAELEDSAEMRIDAVDETHLSVTDVNAGESIIGEYDSSTGDFYCVISEDFEWYVTIVFTDTGDGISAYYENSIGGNIAASSTAMKG